MAKRQLLWFAGILIFLSSCTHSYYSPNTANVPVFKEKNEVRFSASLNSTQNIGGDFQAGYAPTNCIGVIANANVNGSGLQTSGGNGYLYEIGAGYYKPLNVNTKRAKNLFVFETYGVLGLGGYRNYYWDSTGQLNPNLFGQSSAQQFFYPNNYVNMRYLKAYVQPSMSFSHNVIDIILAAKVGFLYTYKVNSTIPETYLTTVPANEQPPYTGTLYGDYQTLTTNRAPFIFEPSLTIRLGFKYVKLQWQYTGTLIANPFLRNVAGVPFAMSVGLSVDIAHRFKKKPPHPSGNEINY